MDTRLRVLLHGDTLVLAGVHAGLAVYPTLDVILCPGADMDVQTLREQHPDVIILEHNVAAAPSLVPPTFAALAEELPDVLLLSIDVDRGRIVMWSGRRLRQFSTDDFVRLIVRHAAPGTEADAAAQSANTTVDHAVR